MPVYTVEIPTPGTTINRQLIHNVVENLMRNMGIENEDVLYLGAAYDNSSQPNATAGDKREVSFGTNAKTFIEVEERRAEDGGFTRAVGYDLEAPLFHNSKYGIKISPNYVTYETSITIKRRAQARSMLGGWTNELQRKIDMGMDTFVTEGSFHYRVPIPTLNLLAACHRAISFNQDQPEKLVDFLKSGFNQGVTIAANDVGKSLTYIMRSTVTRVVGSIDLSSVTKQKENEAGAWSSSFTYVFHFSRPESIVMSYPVMFNNSLIDSKWWYESKAPGVSNEAYASKGVAVAMQDKMSKLPGTISLPVFVPDCDHRVPKNDSRQPGEIDIFVGYLAFDKDALLPNYNLAFNIKDLGDIGFMYSQLTYLRHIGRHDPYMKQSVIKVNVFKNGYIFARDKVYIDYNLDVWVLDAIDISSIYSFSITMDTSLQFKESKGLNLLAEVPGMVSSIVLEFMPEFGRKYAEQLNVIPRPPSPECPDLAEYPYNIKDMIPAYWIDPIQDWREDVSAEFVKYPQYPNKPDLPNDLPVSDEPKYAVTVDPEIIDNLVIDTVTSMKDARNPHRKDNLSIFQLNVFDGNIIARRKE